MTDGVYYLFDCLDGLIGDKLLTLEELRAIMTNDPRPYTEKAYTAILDNDSVYYPELVHGTEMPIEMRGENRPVVPYSWLVKNYGEAKQ